MSHCNNAIGRLVFGEDGAIKTKGLVLIVKELHDRIVALVAEAYGWPADLPDEDILARLVALNAERAAEEKRGLVRWLRPEYQTARAGVATPPAEPDQEQLEAPLIVAAAKEQKPSFPSGEPPIARILAAMNRRGIARPRRAGRARVE